MRCDNFTIYPRGAMMLCEDASEFDENLPERIAKPEGAEPPTAVVVVRSAGVYDADPVAKLAGRLGPVYHECIEPLLSMDFEVGEEETAAEKLDMISHSVNTAVNALRAVLVKYNAIAELVGSSNSICFESSAPYVKKFMMNAQKVKQQGVNDYSYSYNKLPICHGMWRVSDLIGHLIGTPAALETIVSGSMLNMLLSYDSNDLVTFDGIIDLMHCVFDDPARLGRLESSYNCRIEFRELLTGGENGIEVDSSIDTNYSRKTTAVMLKYLSFTLKDVSRRCYDLRCDFDKGIVHEGQFAERISPLLARVVNFFGLGTLLAMTDAYVIRQYKARYDAVARYTELLNDVIDNH